MAIALGQQPPGSRREGIPGQGHLF
jgi:hypothetical protein